MEINKMNWTELLQIVLKPNISIKRPLSQELPRIKLLFLMHPLYYTNDFHCAWQIWNNITHTLAFVILIWWLVHNLTGPLLFPRNLLTPYPGTDVGCFCSSGLYTWARWKAPSSRLSAASLFLIWVASLIFLVNELESFVQNLSVLPADDIVLLIKVMCNGGFVELISRFLLLALVNFRVAILSASFWSMVFS